LDQFCETEIEDLYVLISGDEEIVGFEIAMDDASRVCGREPAGDLRSVLDRLATR